MTLAIACGPRPEESYPDHPIGLAAAVLRDPAFTWSTAETDHFRIHFQPDSYAAGRVDQLQRDTEQARTHGLAILGEKGFGPRIDVFYLESRDQMKRITEFAVRGWTDAAARTVLLVRRGGANQGERHEVMHVLSHNLWGQSRDAFTTGWMSEAVATYAGGPCSGYPIDEIVAYLDRHQKLIPLAPLAERFRTYDDLVAYLQAGSWIGYVRKTYGLQAVRSLWQQGFEGLEPILGESAATIDAEWRASLRTSYPNPRIDWAPLEEDGCQ